MFRVYHLYKQFKPFNETEAWILFKIAAIAEAIGWSLLIGGIIVRDFVLHGNGVPVTIAGRIHGTLFLAYIIAVLALSPSLGWNWFRALIAGACSLPPFGSLIYEMWSANRRRNNHLQQLRSSAQYHLLTKQSVS